ncbi:MAG TPA: DUF1499 domain-containing protein [Longimicrobiaceae bacterium]|nr:DUF1499 domain-containing protein [Longimicrobiaceae bacterium]
MSDADHTSAHPVPGQRHRRDRLGANLLAIALALGIVAFLLVALGGPGYRFGWWHFRTGFDLMKWGAQAGIAAMLLALAGIVLSRRRRLGTGLAALALGFLAFFLPWNWRRSAGDVPPIHDITTDTENPPVFRSLVAVRQADDATNPADYEGDSVAALQREAYPDVRPVWIPAEPDSAYAVALRAVRDLGWEVADADLREGRIEATDQTGWFGFRDDVVIRVMPSSGISRVDVRSVSRVGRGDLGMNAKRIRAYLTLLKEEYGAIERE